MLCIAAKKGITRGRGRGDKDNMCLETALEYMESTKKYFIETYGKGSIIKHDFNNHNGLIKNVNKIKDLNDGFYRLHFKLISADSSFKTHPFDHHMFIVVCDNLVTIYQTWVSIKQQACNLPRSFTLEEFIEHLNNIKNNDIDKAKVSYIKLTNGFVNKAVIREITESITSDILNFRKKDFDENETFKQKMNENKEELEENKSDKAKRLINKIYEKINDYYGLNKKSKINYFQPTDDDINEISKVVIVKDIDEWKIDNSKTEVFVYGNTYYTINWDHILKLDELSDTMKKLKISKS
jgi:hypothetical protein